MSIVAHPGSFARKRSERNAYVIGVASDGQMVLLLPVVQECSAACYESLCMQMEAPCLADSLRGSYSVSCNT